jgi:hypothetical protein
MMSARGRQGEEPSSEPVKGMIEDELANARASLRRVELLQAGRVEEALETTRASAIIAAARRLPEAELAEIERAADEVLARDSTRRETPVSCGRRESGPKEKTRNAATGKYWPSPPTGARHADGTSQNTS